MAFQQDVLELLLKVTGDTREAENDLNGLAVALRELAGQDVDVDVEVDTAAARSEIAALRRDLESLSDVTVNVQADTAGVAGELERVTRDRHVDVDVRMHAQRFQAALAGLLTKVGSFKVTAVASLVALIPAAVGASTAVGGIGVAALGVLAPLGLMGVAMAMAFKRGGPSIQAFKDEIAGIKSAVENATGPATRAAFAGLTQGLAGFGPMIRGLRSNLTGLGQAMGAAFRDLGAHLSSPAFGAFSATMIDMSARALPPLVAIMKSLVDVFMNLATAGAPLFIAALERGAAALARLAEKTSDIDMLRGSMERGTAVLGQLWQVAKNLGGVLQALFTAASSGANSFMASIVKVTGDLSRFFRSAEGQKILRDALASLALFVREIGAAIPSLVQAFGKLLNIVTPIFAAVMNVAKAIGKIPGGDTISAIAIGFIAWKGPIGVAKMLLNGIPALFTRMASARRIDTAATVTNTGAHNAGLLTRIRSTAAMVIQKAALLATAAATRIATTAQWLLNTAMLANPIGLIILAILGIIAIFVLLGGKLSWLTDAFKWAWDAIKTATSAAWNAVKAVIGAVWEWIKTAATAYFNAYVTIITTAWNAIKSVTSAVWNAIKTAASATWNAIKSVITGAVNGAADAVRSVFGALSGFISGVWGAIRGGVSGAWNAIKGAVSSAAGAVVGAVKNAIDGAIDAVAGVWNAIKGGVSKGWDAIKGAVTGAVKGAAGAIGDAFGGFRDAGRKIIDAIVGGVRDAAGKVVDAVKSVIKGAMDLLPGSEPKDPSSPLRNLSRRGEAIMRNLAEGIRPGAAALSQELHASLRALPVVAAPSVAMASDARRAGDTYNVTRNYNLPPGPNGYVEPTFAAAQLDNLLRDEGALR